MKNLTKKELQAAIMQPSTRITWRDKSGNNHVSIVAYIPEGNVAIMSHFLNKTNRKTRLKDIIKWETKNPTKDSAGNYKLETEAFESLP